MGEKFQSIVCFFCIERLISNHMFTILCAQGLKFAITSTLFDAPWTPLPKKTHAHKININGCALKCPILKVSCLASVPNNLSPKSIAKP